eukprot:4432306-Heterocapsa_arctica.AAC.1
MTNFHPTPAMPPDDAAASHPETTGLTNASAPNNQGSSDATNQPAPAQNSPSMTSDSDMSEDG